MLASQQTIRLELKLIAVQQLSTVVTQTWPSACNESVDICDVIVECGSLSNVTAELPSTATLQRCFRPTVVDCRSANSVSANN